jgi:hypothetical protein
MSLSNEGQPMHRCKLRFIYEVVNLFQEMGEHVPILWRAEPMSCSYITNRFIGGP